jgi:hypothetical protein
MKCYSLAINNCFNMIATSVYIGCFRVIYTLLITFQSVTRDSSYTGFRSSATSHMNMQKSFLSMCWRSAKHQSQQQCDRVVPGEPSDIAAEANTASKFQWYIALGALSGHDIMDNSFIWWKVYPLNYFLLLDAHSLLFRLMHMSFQPSLVSLMTTLPSRVQLFNFLMTLEWLFTISAWTSVHHWRLRLSPSGKSEKYLKWLESGLACLLLK